MSFLSLTAGDVASLSAALARCRKRCDLARVVRQAVFLGPGMPRAAVARVLRETYGRQAPPTTYVAQTPVGGAVALELWAFPGTAPLSRSGNACRAHCGGYAWDFIGGLEMKARQAAYPGVKQLLARARTAYASIGADFGGTVRTWYYMGGILRPAAGGDRYAQLNRARNGFYATRWADSGLAPASTAIGMRGGRVSLEAFALEKAPGIPGAVWLDNPLQTPPHRYPLRAGRDRNPCFSRGAAVSLDDGTSLIFVSGTASLRGHEVLHLEDPAAQVRVSIENIAALGVRLADILQFRVYIKKAEHAAAVRRRCEALLPDVPRLYLLADVCREEFSVEIECVAARKRANP